MLTDACPALDAQAFGRSASNSLLGQLTFCQPPFRFQEPSCLFARELLLVSKSRSAAETPGARRAEPRAGDDTAPNRLLSSFGPDTGVT
jgi:hypothetical protein